MKTWIVRPPGSAIVALIVGILFPLSDRAWKVVEACCDHRIARAKKEKKP